jgi:hypothetical protein
MKHLPLGRAARRWLVGNSLLIVAACSSDGRPTGLDSRPRFAISDAAHAGAAPGFFFLPPIVPQPTLSGTFDADITTLDPRIAICDITAGPDVDCGGATAAVIVFTTATTPAITLDPPARYQVNWDTRGTGFLADHTYRVHVTAGASGTRRELGFADVLITDIPGEVKQLATGDSVILNDGRTLPIRFWIGTGIPGNIAVGAATPSVNTGGTDLITATVQDLHGAPVTGAAVAWSVTGLADATLTQTSGQTGADGTTTTTFQAGTTAGTAMVTATSTGLSAMVSVTVNAAAATQFYVANLLGGPDFTGSITVYTVGASDNISPTNTIAGANTGLSDPFGIARDAAGQLYVANNFGNSSITVYAPGAMGNASPVTTIAGPHTGLNRAVGIALGGGNLYVANSVGQSITVYPADASGDATPTATIAGSNTRLTDPQTVALDAAGDVYVVNAFVNRILIFAAGATGNVPPTDSIVGLNTHLDFPQSIAFDAAGNLYVGNLGSLSPSITVYPAGARGNASPTATIAGASTGLSFPFGVAVDATGKLYVANAAGGDTFAGSITVYAAGANGNATPTATITGSNTGLASPVSIAF